MIYNMKNLICLFTLLILILPSCSAADSSDDFLNEEKYLNIDNYYLSLTGSYDDGVLSEKYMTYDFAENSVDEKMCIDATSQYPVGVYDIQYNRVFYSASDECVINGKSVYLDNVYVKDLNTGVVSQITFDGLYINKMIPIRNKLYFIAGQRSKLSLQFGYIDLTDNSVIFSDLYNPDDVMGADIQYNASKDVLYFSWYSLAEQSELYRNFHDLQNEGKSPGYAGDADVHIDMVRCNLTEKERLMTVSETDVYTASVSSDQRHILISGVTSKEFLPVVRLHTESLEQTLKGISITNNVISPDGGKIYFISAGDESDGIPCSVLYCYNINEATYIRLYQFDCYINNIALLPKE